MTTDPNPSIKDLVRFLQVHDQPQLDELKAIHSEYAADFEASGIALAGTDEDRCRARLYLCKTALEAAQVVGLGLIKGVRSKLQSLSSFQMINQIVVLISGATILSTLQNEFKDHPWVKYIAPTLVLLGSILTIISKWKSEALVLGNHNLSDLTGKLVENVNTARVIIAELNIQLEYFDLAEAQKLIVQANDLAKDMNQISDQINISWKISS